RHFGGGCCSGGAFECRLHVIAGSVLHGAVWNFVLHGVDQLNVADGSLDVADITGNALVAFAAHAALPRNASSLADRIFPFRTDLREIVGEDVSGTATVGAMHGDDGLRRQIYAGILLGDARIVPAGDLSEIDVGEDVRRKLQFGGYAGDVVRRDDRPQDGRNVQDLELSRSKLVVGHRTVTCTEIK